jgi:hypothetical protein
MLRRLSELSLLLFSMLTACTLSGSGLGDNGGRGGGGIVGTGGVNVSSSGGGGSEASGGQVGSGGGTTGSGGDPGSGGDTAFGSRGGSGGNSGSGGKGGSSGSGGAGGSGGSGGTAGSSGGNYVSGTVKNGGFNGVSNAYWIGKPDLSSFQTIIYLLEGPLDCSAITATNWNSHIGTNVLEIAVNGTSPGTYALTKDATVGLNRGAVQADAATGSVVLDEPVQVRHDVLGTFTAHFSSGTYSGSFDAVYCANGVEP